MGKEEELALAKRSYRRAKEEGNREEEARWANVVGDILKNRGEYVEALRWLRLDYEVSVKYLPEKQLLPTCQSLGELYLRLHQFKDALIYQKKHLDLAKDANDLVEQQRASTQLGRTYHEMLLKSDDDHYLVRNAKKYFRSAMKLAESLKQNPPANRCSFIKEYVDAHNNIGMLEKDLDDFEEAERFLTKGLEICDEEEIGESDDSRSRLHHNLGSVYMELRVWGKAMEHIEKDILICKRIGHIQGEAKGYINLGELHYRVQKYEDATLCYKKALDLAKSMEDEDVLVEQIDQNIETVHKAMEVLDDIKKEEQILKKLTRKMGTARGTPHERRYLLQQNASLDRLIEKSSIIFAWMKHREFAKRKKRIASQLYDKEKLGDSFLVLGESYQQLRNFKKSIKWFQKSLEMYKSIGNLEGQALAKINIGDVLDSDGDWKGALDAFEDGYRLAVDAKCPSIQLSALENMHYSNMIRFDNIEEARRLQLEIDKLKRLESKELERPIISKDQCSETDTDGDDGLSERRFNAPPTSETRKSASSSKFLGAFEEISDDAPLISLLRPHKHSSRQKPVQVTRCNSSRKANGYSPEHVPKEISAQQKAVGRKRIRLVLSDDEGETQDEVNFPRARHHECLDDDIAIVHETKRETNPPSSSFQFEDSKTKCSKCATCSCCLHNVEESSSSYQCLKPGATLQNDLRSSSSGLPSDFAAGDCKRDVGVSDNAAFTENIANVNLQNSDSTGECLQFIIDDELIYVEARACFAADNSSTESLKAELACLYYMRLPREKRSKGLLPIIQDMKSGGRFLDFETFDALKEHPERFPIEVSIVWVQKRLMKLYVDCCEELHESPNLKLLKKLYISEVEDVVSASDCELQDVSITPLLNALHTQNSIAILDLSHNLLGNGTIEKLQQLFTSGLQYGGLTLDLHCNRFGPTALFQICECPVLFTRLEVLNISGNRLTDTCGSFLSTILEKCKALVSLNIERCSVTSRTIQKVADSLYPDSVLAQLCIGNNNPVSGTSIINLLAKLAILRRFTELSLTNLKLNKAVVNSLCELVKTSGISSLILGSTYIGADGALQVTQSLLCSSQESAKLDFSYCAISSTYISKLNNDIAFIGGIIELNLQGNPIRQEGWSALVSMLTNPQCLLKILILNKCQLGFPGIVKVIHALKENDHLEELYLAENGDLEERRTMQHNQRGCSGALHPRPDTSEAPKACEPTEIGIQQQDVCAVNTNCNQLEVADSEDDNDANMAEAAPSELDDSCTSSCQRNQSLVCQLLEELSTAISIAKQLQLLDLSSNGFSSQEAETLYTAWSSKSGRASALRHIKGDIVHLSTETNRCCRGRPCCRKD